MVAPGIAVSAPFLGELSFGAQGGLQKPVVREKGPTLRFWDQFGCFSRLIFQFANPVNRKRIFSFTVQISRGLHGKSLLDSRFFIVLCVCLSLCLSLCLVLSCPVLSCSVLFCSVLFSFVLFCSVCGVWRARCTRCGVCGVCLCVLSACAR